MKKIISLILAACLCISLMSTAFAIKGGDEVDEEYVLWEFSSGDAITSLDYVKGSTETNERSFDVSSEIKNMYSVSAKLSFGDGLPNQAHWYVNEEKYNVMKSGRYNYICLSMYNSRTASETLSMYAQYKGGERQRLTLNPGWNTAYLPIEYLWKEDEMPADWNKNISLRLIYDGTDGSVYYGKDYYVERIWLAKESSYTYTVEGFKAWEFNTAETIEKSTGYVVGSGKTRKLVADFANTNLYGVSGKYTNGTNGVTQAQMKLTEGFVSAIKEKNADNSYKYNYVNLIICNNQNENRNVTIQINWFSGAKQSYTLVPGWQLVSAEISRLTDDRDNKTEANGFGIAPTTETFGESYNIDLIWLSETEPSKDEYKVNSYTVAADENSKAKADVYITNLPGERFAIILAAYDDGELVDLVIKKEYDGHQHDNEKFTITSENDYNSGYEYKIMLWDGFKNQKPSVVQDSIPAAD